jgi:putative CocE/NonD family hydrolase
MGCAGDDRRPKKVAAVAKITRFALPLVLGCVVVSAHATSFLVYEKGIKTTEIRAAAPFLGECRTSSRDHFTARWSPITTDFCSSPKSGLGQLPGSLRLLGQLGSQLDRSHWTAAQPVRLTTASGIELAYESRPITQPSATVRRLKARRWLQINGSLLRERFTALDLVFDDRGGFLAAIDPSNDCALVRAGLEEVVPTMRLWARKSISQAVYGIKKTARSMVTMSDGVRLATDVYLPDGPPDRRYPVLFMRTPYDARPVIDLTWQYVARGYAVVVQDVRGRYGSEGDFLVDRFELKDGDESLTWIAHQRWSNGKIGMMGSSYPGHAQWMAAYQGNPALKALIPIVSMGTPHNDMPYIGGALDIGVAEWTLRMDGGQRERPDLSRFLRIRPFKAIGRAVLGKESPLWDQIADHQLYDDYWKATDWLRYERNINVPALHISGWYDDDHPGTLANWAMMARNHRANQRMILGAWRHSVNTDRELNGVKFGAEALRADFNFLMQEWYDRFLKGMHNGVEEGPPVQYFSVGDNKWRSADAWPPRDARTQSWFLHGDGNSATAKTGSLSDRAPGRERPDAYRYDPEDPTPSLINVSYNEQSLPDDYAKVENRSDVAVYQTPRITKTVRIAGPITAVIYASSSAQDTDWIVRLSDVDSTGHAYRLVEGVIRARFRNSLEKEELLTPDKIERYEIPMRSHANSFLPGHRIRMSISSAAAGYIYPNSNTGENEALVTRTVPAEQHIYHDAQYPSHLLLPVTPR